ncbi:MAG: DUF1963 domain-containing protein, partial [Myxococcales bacterium]|nr:DUF1963 domain-containing protein [Myxococcales bacterium]
PGMEWPEGLYFGAQLNLVELAKVDCSDRLPKDGMLYVFYNLAEEFQVIHWRGPVEDLERREYPPRSAFPDARHYYDEFMAGERIDFKPYWLLIFNEGEAYDHPEARRILPPDRIEAISSVLGAPLGDRDCSRRIYGRRVGDFEISGFDERGEPIWDDPESQVVLFHDQIADTFLHLWCSPEAAARGDFSRVECTGWCS